MFRIGIIGTENSHAMAFANIFNCSGNYDGMRVTMVYGPDMESAQAIADKTGASIAPDPQAFLGQVDAMMITSRKGSLHWEYARPFIEAKIPLFIDKPLTSSGAQAMELVALAEKNNVPLCAGSGCKYAAGIEEAAALAAQWRKEGKLLAASMNFAADRNSEYDGLFFYAPHLTEMALKVCGENPLAVSAASAPGSILASLRYGDCMVSLHYVAGAKHSACVLYGQEENRYIPFDISQIYDAEAAHFAHMLRTGEMPQPYASLVLPVTIIEAVLQSLEEKKEILL